MRILHLSTLYPPHIVGGAERSVSMLAERQVQHGHTVAAACLTPGAAQREQRNGVAVYRMPHGNDFWMEDWTSQSPRAREWAKFKQQANFAIERRFAEVIEDFKPDLVNTHSMVDISTRVWHAAKRQAVPIVHTLRDFDLVCAASSMYREETGPCLHRHLKCRVLTFTKQFDQRLVSGVTSVGREILEKHLSFGFFDHIPPERRAVIWNTAQFGGEAASERRALSADRPFTFGYLGRISAEKGVDVLLRAVRRLPAGWKLKIAGVAAGSMEQMERLAKGLPVEFLGFVEPRQLFDQIDVLVTPSLWAEPLGRSVLEAYSVGLPVIGSATGGIAELIADDDWLFRPGDELALAKLMGEKLALGRAALPRPERFARVVEKTEPDAVAKAFEEFYAAVV